jgi:hypothetical protein
METRIRLAIVLDGLPVPHVVLHEPTRIPWTVRRAMIASNGTPERSSAS